MKKSELAFSAILVPVDYCMVLLAGLFAYNLRFISFFTDLRPITSEIIFQRYLQAIFVVPIFFIIVFALAGLYTIRNSRRLFDEVAKIFIACTASIALVIIIIFFQRELFSSRFIVLFAWLLSIGLVVVGRLIVRTIQHLLLRRGLGAHNLIIFGEDKVTEEITKFIYRAPALGYRIVSRYSTFDDVIRQELEGKLSVTRIDECLLADVSTPKPLAIAIREFCNDHHISYKYATDLFDVSPTHIEIDTIAGIPILEVKRTRLDGWGRIFKRGFDIAISLVSLIILLPLFLIIALVIIIDSEGGVFKRLDRIGEKGKRFQLFKFRSMVKNAHQLKQTLVHLNERSEGPLFKIKNDPRITRVGRFIRKTSIDELPQLINVLKGDMSLVGPRPHEPEEVHRYERWHRKLLAIKPGMTGLAQISGRSDLKFDDEAKLDIYYIENWSPGLDIQILIKTPWVVIVGSTAS